VCHAPRDVSASYKHNAHVFTKFTSAHCKVSSYASETTFIVAHCFDWPGLRRVPSVTVVLQLSSYRLDSNISCKVSLAFAFCYEHLLNRR